jgi:hypothetical protein
MIAAAGAIEARAGFDGSAAGAGAEAAKAGEGR